MLNMDLGDMYLKSMLSHLLSGDLAFSEVYSLFEKYILELNRVGP